MMGIQTGHATSLLWFALMGIIFGKLPLWWSLPIYSWSGILRQKHSRLILLLIVIVILLTGIINEILNPSLVGRLTWVFIAILLLPHPSLFKIKHKTS